MKKLENEKLKWHKLDNTAVIFPIISGDNFSNVFRFSAILEHQIDPVILKKALINILPYYENFNLRLKTGFFWHYYESNLKEPIIEKEQDEVCSYFDSQNYNDYLFRVTYYKNKINLEVFHALTDGLGTISFFKSIIGEYLSFINSDMKPEILSNVSNNLEDSYLKNYQTIKDETTKIKKSYPIKDKLLPFPVVKVTQGYIPFLPLKRICKKKNVTITEYLSASFIWATYQYYKNKKRKQTKKQLVLNIPVNLRQFFPSTTMTNFFGIASIHLELSKNEYCFEDILYFVKQEFQTQITKNKMQHQIARNVAIKKNIFIRFIPLFMKKAIARVGYKLFIPTPTILLTNVGNIETPTEWERHIKHLSVLVDPSDKTPIKCGVATYKNSICCSFTSRLQTSYIEYEFFKHLADKGLNIDIESNGVDDES